MDEIRAIADAVTVGVGTALIDDPHFTLDDPGLAVVRGNRGGSPHSARVVTNSCVRTPTDARILDDATTTYLFVSGAASGDRHEALRAVRAELVTVGTERVSPPDIFDALGTRGVDRLTVEGGGELILLLFKAGLVDELTLHVGSLVIGGRNAPTLTNDNGLISGFPRLSLRDMERVDDGVFLTCDC